MKLKNLTFYADLHLVKMRARARGEEHLVTDLQSKYPEIFDIEFEKELEKYCQIREAFTKIFSQEELKRILSENSVIH
jgi:hypothetical protein